MDLILQLDYTKVGLFSNLNDSQRCLASEDYAQNLSNLLIELNCNKYYIRNIITSILWTNINDKAAYHTPIHVLYMLSFAQLHNIKLDLWEILAVYFHDAIYRPESKKNESNSIQYMFALLTDTGISSEILTETAFAIQSTALHLETYVSESHNKFMDLDMSMFACDTPIFLQLCNGIESEYCNETDKNFNGITVKDFLIGRLEFLNKLLNKKSIFRSSFFAEFENKAKENIMESIKICEERLKTYK